MGQDASRRSAHCRIWERGLKLRRGDKKRLTALMSGGRASVRAIKRARVLQLLAEGETRTAAAKAAGVAVSTVGEIRDRYKEGGLDRILEEAPRGIPERALNDKQEQRLVAMLCGPQPSGRARWTIRLARDEAIERGIVATIGRETVRVAMKNHKLKPWREKKLVHSGVDAGVREADGRAS